MRSIFVVLLLLAGCAVAAEPITVPKGAHQPSTTPTVEQPNPRCAECSAGKPCHYVHEAGDGCNTCQSTAWCEAGKWYSGGGMCTLRVCTRKFEIANPFAQ